MVLAGFLTFLSSLVYHAYPSRSLLPTNIRMADEVELELEPRVGIAEIGQISSELGSSSKVHGDDYFQRSRDVLNVRTRQWAEGLPKGSSCRPSIDRCDLDCICSANERCEPLKVHIDEDEESEQIPARKYDQRCHEIMKIVEEWTLNLREGVSCFVDGKRCNLGLDCINGKCQKSII